MDKYSNDLARIYMKQCPDKKLLSGVLTIHRQNPPIKTVIFGNITNRVLEVIEVDNSIIIVGRLCLKVEYAANVPCNDDPVYFCSFVINYTHLICLKEICRLPPDFSCNNIKVNVKFEQINEISPCDISYLILLEFKLI